MPRYSTASVLNVEVLKNPASIAKKPKDVDMRETYTHIPSDLKLSWSNDLVFNDETVDYEIAHHIEAYAQRLFLRLITQKGTDPANPNFGWDFEYLIDKPDTLIKEYLPIIVRDVKYAVESDSDTLSVENVEASLVNVDNQTSYIKVSVTVKVRGFEDILALAIKII